MRKRGIKFSKLIDGNAGGGSTCAAAAAEIRFKDQCLFFGCRAERLTVSAILTNHVEFGRIGRSVIEIIAALGTETHTGLTST